MSVIVKGGGGKSSGLYVWKKHNADIGLGESINNIALANDGTAIDTYLEENLYIKEDGTIGVQGEPYSTVSISSVVEDTCIGGMTPTKYCIGVDGNVYSSPLSHIAGSVDNCVANLVKVVKSTFIDFVVFDSETAYPDGAVHTDGYWYEKVVEWVDPLSDTDLIASNIRKGVDIWGVIGTLVEGKTGIDFGSLTIPDRHQTSVTVSHRLGKKPSWVALIAVDFINAANGIAANIGGYAVYNGGLQDAAFYSAANTLSSTSITFSSGSVYQFKQTDFYWIAIA